MGKGFNALCWAMAGYWTIEGFIRLQDWRNRERNMKAVKAAREGIDIVNNLVKKLDEYDFGKVDAEQEEVESA